jgi:uracil-DNA glycosylase
MFTGDSSGDTLYSALHRSGFANQPGATQELANCQPFLMDEISLLTGVKIVLALGGMAFNGYLRAMREIGHDLPRLKFRHGAWHPLSPGLPILAACYHPSRQNTQTGRLTEAMLDDVFKRIRDSLDAIG